MVRLGDMVQVKACGAAPELVGSWGDIVQIQTQEYERYSVRPIWVELTTGPFKGKSFGFWETELERIDGLGRPQSLGRDGIL